MSKENYSTNIYNQLKRGVRNTLFYGLTAAVLSSPILPELTYAANKNSKSVRTNVVRQVPSKCDTSNVKLKVYRHWEGPLDSGLNYTLNDPNKLIDIRHESLGRKNKYLGLAGLDSLVLDLNVRPMIVRDTVTVRDTVEKKVSKYIVKYVQKPETQKTTQPYEAPKKTESNQPQTQYQIPIKTPSEKPSILTKPNYLETIVSEPAHKDSITVNQTRINNTNKRIHNEFHKGSKWPWVIGGAAVAAGIYFLVKDNKEKSDESGSGVTGGETGGAGVR